MTRPAMTTEEKAEIWRRYRSGASLRSIHQALGRAGKTVWSFVASTGGIPPVERSRAALRLSLGRARRDLPRHRRRRVVPGDRSPSGTGPLDRLPRGRGARRSDALPSS